MTNVLLVDDDENFIDVAKMHLEDQEPSFMLTTSNSAEEAFIKLAETQYDVIISDYKMPKMNGLAFLKSLRERDNSTPFIMFTGQGREEVAMDALNLGADYYLMKGADAKSTFGELAHIIRQVAEHKRIEEALRESEELFSKAFQLSPQPIVISRLSDGLILEVNEALVRTGGYSREDLIGHTSVGRGLIRTEVRERLKEIFQEQGALRNFEASFFTQTGEERLGSFSGEVINLGDELCLIIVVDDITERKQAEEAVRRERDLIQQYLDTVGVILDVLDRQANIVMINKKGCEVLGYDNDAELLGKNWIDTVRAEDDREAVRELYKALMEGDLNLIERYEDTIITRTGEERVISWHHSLLRDESGGVSGILSSGTDITDQKRAETALQESEETLRKIIDAIPVGISITSPEGQVIEANSAAWKINGYDSKEDFLQINATALWHDPTEREKYVELLKGNVLRDFEAQFKKKDGTVFWGSATSIMQMLNNRAQLINTFQDITERKQAEEALQQSEEKFYKMFNEANDLMVLLDEQGKLVELNQKGCELANLERDQLVGKDFVELDVVLPQDIPF
ncbi:MAG: PAS domain S-box protein, partial [Candidatus Thorarchaeota archaeon]